MPDLSDWQESRRAGLTTFCYSFGRYEFKISRVLLEKSYSEIADRGPMLINLFSVLDKGEYTLSVGSSREHSVQR